MFNKLVKSLLILPFICCFTSFASLPPTSEKSGDIIDKYNDFLKSINLSEWIKATELSKGEETGMPDAAKGLNVLILEPQPAFDSPLEFAPVWKQLVEKFSSRVDLYHLLFLKLADYDMSGTGHLAIYLRTSSPDLFSLFIYNNDGIKYEINSLNTRDGGPVVNLGDFGESSVGGMITNIKTRPNLELLIRNRLSAFLKANNHTGDVEIKYDRWAPGAFRLAASNLRGVVTPNFHEMIYINIFILTADDSRVNVGFLFTVLYSGGILRAPSKISDYKDARGSYLNEVSTYGSKLRQLLSSAFN